MGESTKELAVQTSPGEAVEFVARQVQVPAVELGAYEWTRPDDPVPRRAQIRGLA